MNASKRNALQSRAVPAPELVLDFSEAPDIDFTADIPEPTPGDLQNVSAIAQKLVALQSEEAELGERLRKVAEARRTIEERDLPEAMDACGMASFKLKDGHEVQVKPIVAGSIPKAKLHEALEWLRSHGHSGLIKREISVALARGKDKLGDHIVAQLQKLGVETTTKETVHAQTLAAWAREMLADPTTADIPLDLLGIYVGRRATVK